MKLVNFCFKKLAGLRFDRVAQWHQVVLDEIRSHSVPIIALSLLKGGLGIGGVSKMAWRRRIRVCQRCPVYDRRRKTCRPFIGAKIGCGCYMPFKAMVRRRACWVRVVDPKSKLGFDN